MSEKETRSTIGDGLEDVTTETLALTIVCDGAQSGEDQLLKPQECVYSLQIEGLWLVKGGRMKTIGMRAAPGGPSSGPTQHRARERGVDSGDSVSTG